MGYVALSDILRSGQTLVCKYPKHGVRNVLKYLEGVVVHVGDGPHGTYALMTSADGKHRTLRCDKMVDAKVF